MDFIPPEITGGARSRLLDALDKIEHDYRTDCITGREVLHMAAAAYLEAGCRRQEVALWTARWVRQCRLTRTQRQTRPGIGGSFKGFERPLMPWEKAAYETITEDETARGVAEVIKDLLDPPAGVTGAAIASPTNILPIPVTITEKPAGKPAKRCLKRARWLRRKEKDGWTPLRIEAEGGPDHKTVRRILQGFPVQGRTLQKLASALGVQLIDIPKC
jgi:hypothetical protein